MAPVFLWKRDAVFHSGLWAFFPLFPTAYASFPQVYASTSSSAKKTYLMFSFEEIYLKNFSVV